MTFIPGRKLVAPNGQLVQATHSEVKVQLRREDDGSLFFRVHVRSNVFPLVTSHVDVPVSADRLPVRIQAAAGALAEFQIDKYGDQHEPRECARMALAAFREVEAKTKRSDSDAKSARGEEADGM